MTHDIEINNAMLGVYRLYKNHPVEPEIVLTNCTNPAMVDQIMQMTSANEDVHFFLMESDSQCLTNDSQLFFIKDGCNWTIAFEDTLLKIWFDDASFNPKGSEMTFAVLENLNGKTETVTNEPSTLSVDDLLANSEDDIQLSSRDNSGIHEDSNPPLIIDPSVLTNSQEVHEINDERPALLDALDLPEGTTIKTLNTTSADDGLILYTELLVADALGTNTFYRLLGVSPQSFEEYEAELNYTSTTEGLILYMIDSENNEVHV